MKTMKLKVKFPKIVTALATTTKKPFSDNYSFQQSVHNRHPTAAFLIILFKRTIYML